MNLTEVCAAARERHWLAAERRFVTGVSAEQMDHLLASTERLAVDYGDTLAECHRLRARLAKLEARP